MALPQRCEIVVIGGGVIGCSIAYHLARQGAEEVLLLERRYLTEGSTWHAAGLVGQLRTSSSLAQLMRRSVEIYETLEGGTGYPTGWRGVGSLRVAASDDRWEEIRRTVITAKSFGLDAHLVTASEALELLPLLDVAGVRGASWVPSDGYVDPSQLTNSFAAGARALGVKIVQDCRVDGIERSGRRVVSVLTPDGRVECDSVVNATGMWGAPTAGLAGVRLPVATVEHQYVVTEKSAGVAATLPTLRDPDGLFYMKPEAGGLVVGGWEPGTRSPWRQAPAGFGPELFEPDHQRFAVLAENATRRMPLFGELGIQTWVNGPIPFSPDGEPLMGRTEDLDNLFHCCGFSAGVAAAGGAGEAMAAWILDGDPGMDLWPFDVRRFGPGHAVPAYLAERAVEAYSSYYHLRYPGSQRRAARGQRRSPLYPQLAAKGACFGEKYGWERADWFAEPSQEPVEELTFGRSNAHERVAGEARAVREDVGLIDQTSFSKLRISGPGALELLQAIAGADLDVPIGKVTYCQLLNARAGIEADVTVTRLGEADFYLVTGSASGRHDATFLLQHASSDGTVSVSEITSAVAVLNLCGPRSREVLARLSWTDLSNDAFPYMTAQEIDAGFAPVRALRVTYVGELGWELHVPVEYAAGLYEALWAAGAELGLRDVGYRAVESLRLEKHYLAWGSDIGPDTDPYEAGLGFAVSAAKEGLVAGRALRSARERGIHRKLCWFSTDPGVVMHGGELLTNDTGDLVATVRSAGFGHTVRRTIFSAYVQREAADGEQDYVVDVAGVRHQARRDRRALYDPDAFRPRDAQVVLQREVRHER